MQLEDFVKCIQECGIVKDQGTIHRLFDALTVGKPLSGLFLPLLLHFSRQTFVLWINNYLAFP